MAKTQTHFKVIAVELIKPTFKPRINMFKIGILYEKISQVRAAFDCEKKCHLKVLRTNSM